MFVRCSDCANHYDDSWQNPKCVFGTGTDGYIGQHPAVRVSPIVDHVESTRRARMSHALGGRPAAPEPPVRHVDAPLPVAPPSDG